MRRLLPRLIVAVLVSAMTFPSSVAAAAPTIDATIVQSGLTNPWDLTFLPDGRMLVTERPGRIRVYASGTPGAALLRTAVLGLGVRAEGEAGLMGIAADSAFASNRYIYVCVSRQVGGDWLNQLVRYRLNDDLDFIYAGVLIWGMRANTVHNGCAVKFTSGAKIWVSIGDGGVPSRAQDPASLNGKILRINRDGSIPGDNPVMPGAGKRTAVYSMGHRNPQGLAFTAQGALYAIEHGPDRDDEINRIQPGGNFGWPCYTGAAVRWAPYAGPCGPASAYDPPAWSSGSSTIATSGGAFARSNAWGDWRNHLFVAQLKQADLRRFTSANLGSTLIQRQVLFDQARGRIRGVVMGPDGDLYLTTSNGGGSDLVIRLRPTA
ncbi:MAG: PQQ-dependent sugar dehydrogenase [Candidatus Limnocylindria bacterium]